MVLLSACTNEKPKSEEQFILEGKWNIQEAIRKGKVTDALNGIYFEFLPESKMVSTFNPTVEPIENTFSIKDKILTEQNTIEGDRTFVIEQVDDENLVLSTEYQGVRFKLFLSKTK